MERRSLTYIINLAAAALIMWLAFRFVLPWTAPVLVAFCAAAVFEPAVRSMVRGGWRRAWAAAVLTCSVPAMLLFFLSLILNEGTAWAAGFLTELPELLAAALELLRGIRDTLSSYMMNTPESVRQYLDRSVSTLESSVYALPAGLSQRAMAGFAALVQAAPDILLFTVTAGIGSFFISASYPEITAFLLRQLPDDTRAKLYKLKHSMRQSLGGFIRAQLLLMLITFFELLAVFLLMGIKNAAGIAAVTALVDALPVFGTGTVLVPWAVFCAIGGRMSRALGLLLCWGGVNLVRSCLQAKLVGDRIGLQPVVSLIAIYTGWRIAGVWGMLGFPLLFVVVGQLNAQGIIKLWKN